MLFLLTLACISNAYFLKTGVETAIEKVPNISHVADSIAEEMQSNKSFFSWLSKLPKVQLPFAKKLITLPTDVAEKRNLLGNLVEELGKELNNLGLLNDPTVNSVSVPFEKMSKLAKKIATESDEKEIKKVRSAFAQELKAISKGLNDAQLLKRNGAINDILWKMTIFLAYFGISGFLLTQMEGMLANKLSNKSDSAK